MSDTLDASAIVAPLVDNTPNVDNDESPVDDNDNTTNVDNAESPVDDNNNTTNVNIHVDNLESLINGNDNEDDESESESETETETETETESEEYSIRPTQQVPSSSSSASSSIASLQECEYCCEEYPRTDFLSLRCKDTICRTCYHTMLTTCIEYASNNYRPLCPSCLQVIDLGFVNVQMNAPHYDETRKITARLRTLQDAVSSQDNLERCYCPRKRCGAEVIVSDKASRVQCPKCEREFCCRCLEAHSRFVPCSAHEVGHCVTNPGYLACKTWKWLHTKQCPKCGVHIHKISGCNHMHCANPGCGAYFCFGCGHDLNKGGMHCLRWWVLGISAAVVGAGAAAVVAIPTAPLWVPVAVGGVVVYKYQQKRRRQQRQQRYYRHRKY